jgi:transcriptional regulator with XRE-family HTH domain
MKAIGKQLRKRREAEGITQIQLAARATVSRNMISRIEVRKDQNVSLATLRALADALDCDLVVKLKPRSSTLTLTGEHDVEVKSCAADHQDAVDAAALTLTTLRAFMGVDYAKPGSERTARVVITPKEDIPHTKPAGT